MIQRLRGVVETDLVEQTTAEAATPAGVTAVPVRRQPRHSRRGERTTWLTLLVMALLVAPVSLAAGRVLADRVFPAVSHNRPAALPADAAGAPLGVPAPAPPGSGGYRVLQTQDDGSGTPVRWDPCRPVHYVVRPDGAPRGGAQALSSAFARISRLTGLRFVSDGTTTERPRESRPAMDRARYGSRWSPVLIAWTDPAEHPPMSGYAGLGGPDTAGGGEEGTLRYVSGVVLLNREYLARVVDWPEGPERLEAVVLHELGHLVGLDHVGDERELMFRRPTALPGVLGDGDRRGLAALSGGPCFRDF